MCHALIAGLDRCAIGNLQQPFADLSLRKVAVDVRTNIQERVLQANALELLGQARRLYMGDIGVSEQLLNDLQVHGFTVTAIAHQDKYLLEPAIRKQHIAGQRLQDILPVRVLIGDILDKRAPGRTPGFGIIVVIHNDGTVIALRKVPEPARVNLQSPVLKRHHRVSVKGHAANGSGFQKGANRIHALRRRESLAVQRVGIVLGYAIGNLTPNFAVPLIESNLVHIDDVMDVDDFIDNLRFRRC